MPAHASCHEDRVVFMVCMSCAQRARTVGSSILLIESRHNRPLTTLGEGKGARTAMSFLRPRVSRPRGRGWGLAASATFAARRDFELLKLLSTADPSVIAVARQLGASLDVSSAEHVPAGKGAAKRAAPTRGSDVGAASSSTKPRRRRKRVVSEVQRAKKDANFQAKLAPS